MPVLRLRAWLGARLCGPGRDRLGSAAGAPADLVPQVAAGDGLDCVADRCPAGGRAGRTLEADLQGLSAQRPDQTVAAMGGDYGPERSCISQAWSSACQAN